MILLSFLIFGSQLLAAETADPKAIADVIKIAFGPAAATLEEKLQQKKFTAENRPENNLIPMPQSYFGAIQGFYHAAMVARYEGAPYILESTPNKNKNKRCEELSGDSPYIILRAKSDVIGNRARFEKTIDELALAFFQVDFGYSRAEIKNWRKNPKKHPKPVLPDMYCTEVPVTLHRLLGIDQKRSTSMNEILDIGLKAEIENGKSPEQAVRETIDGFVGNIKTKAAAWIKMYTDYIEEQRKAETPNVENIAWAESQIKQFQNEGSKLAAAIGELEEALKIKVGILPELNQCETCRKGTIQKLKEMLWPILQRLDALAVQIQLLNEKIVRPIDLIKDSLDPKGNYEIVGYHAGDLPERCKE